MANEYWVNGKVYHKRKKYNNNNFLKLKTKIASMQDGFLKMAFYLFCKHGSHAYIKKEANL